MAFSTQYVLLSEWMVVRFRNVSPFYGSECEDVSDCSVFVCMCALLRLEMTSRVACCIDSTLRSYEHGCNGEEQNDKDEAGNRQLEQQMENRGSL